MKAYVYVSLKKSVLDPQGKTIHGALKKMGTKASTICVRASILRSRSITLSAAKTPRPKSTASLARS